VPARECGARKTRSFDSLERANAWRSVQNRSVAYLGILWKPQTRLNGSKSIEQIVVDRVIQKSPAERAGVQVGDRVRSIDGLVIDGHADLSALICAKLPGATLALELQRGDKKLSLKIVLGERQIAAFKLRAMSESRSGSSAGDPR
jgi:S1-C subfamily serine protease